MNQTTYVLLLAIGAAICVLPIIWGRRVGQLRSLTVWILSMIGLGIMVGAAFHRHAEDTFRPKRASIPSTLSEALFIPAGEELQLSIRTAVGEDGTPVAQTASLQGRDSPYSLEELASLLSPSVPSGEAVVHGGKLVLRTTAKGAMQRIEVSDVTPGAASRLGLAPNQSFVGAGEPKSLARDIHDFLKTLFINALKMMIIPVIFTSIISGMLSLGGQGIGRIGLKTLAYYLTTSLAAIIVGLILVNLIKPGSGAVLTLEESPIGFQDTATQSTSEFLFNFFLNLIPTNPVRAMVNGEILQIIVFALLIGYFINRSSEPYRNTLVTVFEGLFQVMIKIVTALLWLAPLGVYAIFVKVIAETGPEAFIDLGWYALTVFVGLVVHATVTLPILIRVVGGVSPWRHFKAMGPALLTAFSTSSSSATLPMTMRCVQERAGVSNRTSSFVLPLGATVNMDGTALYECVAAMFIAQIYIDKGVIPPLEVTSQILVVITALAASIGAAGVPMAGMVMLGIILHALGLPLEGVGYVLAVDRVLDMCRTTVNVWSDSSGCAIIARLEGETEVLKQWPPKELT